MVTAQAGVATQAVKTRARAHGRVRLWTLVTAAVTQGSCVVCAQLVRTGHSGWKGSATVAVNRRQGRLCWSYGGSDQECTGRGSNGAGGGSGLSHGGGRGWAMGGRYEVT